MPQSAFAAPPDPNRSPGSRDIDSAPSVSSRLRPNRQIHEPKQTTAKDTVAPNRGLQSLKKPGDESEAAETTPVRMTRQRTAVLATPAELPTRKEDEISPQSATSTEAVSQICLCQPDPKIRRPRNAFILYRQHHQQNIISQHRGLSNPEISKIAGHLWQAEPEEVKNGWKALAEEEKVRHAQQYPDYRFQPRHKTKTSPTSAQDEKVRCQKCGGQTITPDSSPFPTPLPPTDLKLKLVRSQSLGTPTNNSLGRKLPGVMLNSNGHAQHGDLRYGDNRSPVTRKFPDAATEPSDLKRRRYENYSSTAPTTRPEFVRTVIRNGQTPTSARLSYPSPRIVDPRRGSVSASTEGPYYIQRGSIGNSTESLTPTTPHIMAPIMGPPPTRVASISGRIGLQAYPATPASPQHHGLPYSPMPRARNDSESQRLTPLLSPGARDHSKSIAAMIMSIPVLGKIGQLRRITQPIKDPSPDLSPYRVRGSIIAIEGDERTAAEALLGQLDTFLRRNDEFDVRVLSGPREPRQHCTLKDFIETVAEWHDETKKMIDFVTGMDYQRAGERRPSKESYAAGPDDAMDMDTEAFELVEGQRKAPADACRQKRARELENEKMEMAAAVEHESCHESAAQKPASKIPLLLVSNYILHGSNAWSSALPINDVYSPADHWAWTATLWRGIIGADMTVYVKNVDKEREEPVSAGGARPPPMEKKVEMKDNVGAILVKQEDGKIEDGAVRRVAFEVGEWVRMQAGKHT